MSEFFCPSGDSLIGSNFLLHCHQLKLQNTEADKNLYITKELIPNIAEAISYHFEPGCTDHI